MDQTRRKKEEQGEGKRGEKGQNPEIK